MCETHVLIW